MGLAIAASAATLLVSLVGTGSAVGIQDARVAIGQLKMRESSCNTTTYFSVRSAWASEDEPCQQKLPLDMWAFMRAQGSAQDADAQHVFVECMREPNVGLMELLTASDWNSNVFSALPGEVVSQSEHAVSFQCKGAEDLEAICDDEHISKASPVVPIVESHGGAPRAHRRLQTTTSEAGRAHQVDELIRGLQDLSCSRTTGEDQTICVLSDSFNHLGGAGNLQLSGDLPPVDVVKELPGTDGTDEGSAMLELAFDIAPGANYKFNTASLGEQTFADDIGILADTEQCDVIVDDVAYPTEPSFRDGVVASAVDAATQDHDILYFSSAGNSGFGHRFVPDWECQRALFGDDVDGAPCTEGVSAHVFVPSDLSFTRYFFPFYSTSSSFVFLKLDMDEGSAPEMTMVVWSFDFFYGLRIASVATSAAGSATVFAAPRGDGQLHFISIHQTSGTSLEQVYMHLLSWGDQFASTTGITSGSMFGHACATNALSVAAIPFTSASGNEGAFADPEPSPVEGFSSRGPCFVDDGQGLSARSHPVTTAADALQTSTSAGFNPFSGTSAAAPVAAAIATIIRAACFPRVVTYSDMMEMLTDYEYTIDATSDAGGAPETFGPDAGYGIMSAKQMCRWVSRNCADTCPGSDANVHGDPHLVGLAGQKFDFTGQSNSWYALFSACGTDHVNMRVTAPIADLPVVTYITGISVQTKDDDGVGHSIVIFVSDPSVLDSRCPADGQPCIGDGALTVLLDGVSVTSPGETELGPGVSFVAANIPGECRPFGFERYWQQKVREAELLATESRRRLSAAPTMDRWIADDASAKDPTECKEYVSNALEHDGLFAHQSDHVSFQIITPNLALRLNHGKLHQLPKRDPTDTFEIPDHTTFQMNIGFMGIISDDNMQGIIGETAVPTMDERGDKIMSGLEAIRGKEEDYRVIGPLGKEFEQLITGV